MDTKEFMVIIKGQIKTSEIMSCVFNKDAQKWEVKFKNGKTYVYACTNVEKLTEPQILNPDMYHISREGRKFYDIASIYVFRSEMEIYWHIFFCNGSERDYNQKDLYIVKSCLSEEKSSNVFEYIKQIAALIKIRNPETGEVIDKDILARRFNKISFVGEDVALAKYLNPSSLNDNEKGCEYNPIFPFGCNNSQYKAVKNALENQISVIQGPPGTGKTQTILNIIANILLEGKTVQIVSNNNSAVENVYEKLSSPKYNLGFIVAMLGNFQNKKIFIENQKAVYPDFSSWKTDENPNDLKKKIAEQSLRLKIFFDKQEKLAFLKQELSQLATEHKYFNQYVDKSNVNTDKIKFKKKLSSKQWMALWQEFQLISESRKKISIWFKIKSFFMYGITTWDFYKQDISKIIITIQAMYYDAKQSELSCEIANAEEYLNGVNKNLLDDLCNQSMVMLKDSLARKYDGNSSRKIFNEDNLWKNSYEVLKEYPVILSTTFSSRNSLNSDVVYDYLIMDEASQVDIATGTLALSCARNIVIVGDTKQLPNIVDKDMKTEAKEVFDRFNVNEGYHYTKSFLQSILDVIKKEIIPKYVSNPEETGIIAPYKNQVEALRKEITDIDVATVHKFQGREKENIIISTVDDEISDFVDNPYLINVAVSRAKKSLKLVVTGNEQPKERNITELIDYIKYNNFEVADSKIHSIFDYLYKQYMLERIAYLQNRKKISEYDSENLMYSLIEEIIADNKYSSLDVLCHFPLNMLIDNPELLNEKEYKYAMNPATHLDFLIYNRISKKFVLAIEVDGYKYHKNGTVQASRDLLKNHIMEMYEMPLLRLKTNGSGEKEKIIEMLDKMQG